MRLAYSMFSLVLSAGLTGLEAGLTLEGRLPAPLGGFAIGVIAGCTIVHAISLARSPQ